MNLLVLDRYLLFLLDGIRRDSASAATVLTRMWTQEERLQALNNGYSEVCKLIRRNRKDHLTRRRLSTDGSVFIRNQTYDTTNFRIVPGVASYTMPPDYLEIRGIRPTTSGREQVTFEIKDEADVEFRDRRRTTNTSPTLPGLYYCAVTGERTITLAPTPQETLDIELAYVAQMEPLRLYATGSVTLSTASSSVTIVTGTWDERTSGIRPGDELLVGSTTAAPSTATADLLTTRFPKLATVSAAGTTAGLAEQYLGVGNGYVLYSLASVPQFHEDWHYAIAHWAVWELLKPIESGAEQARAAAQANWDRVSSVLIPESANRSSQQVETAEDGWYLFE